MTAPQTRYPQAILVSCEIPWDENESLLDDVFRRSVQATLEHYNHLYIFGTAVRVMRSITRSSGRSSIFSMTRRVAKTSTRWSV